jgi:hypothetical protein
MPEKPIPGKLIRDGQVMGQRRGFSLLLYREGIEHEVISSEPARMIAWAANCTLLPANCRN